MRFLSPVVKYLANIKNLATHFVFGIIMLALILFVPLDVHVRVAALVGAVCLNVMRMRWESKRAKGAA